MVGSFSRTLKSVLGVPHLDVLSLNMLNLLVGVLIVFISYKYKIMIRKRTLIELNSKTRLEEYKRRVTS